MALKVPRAGGPDLFKSGYKHMSGLEEAVLRNIAAVGELSEIVRTSFGPNGRNKLIINHLGRLFVTSDAATIIREIEVAHPAAKLLVMASTAQEGEMGDATNLVLIFAGELLKRSEHLLTMGLHPSDVIQGYEMALAKGREELETLVSSTVAASPLPTIEQLAKSVSASLASKQPGCEGILSKLVAEAALAVMPKNPKDFNVDSIRVVKVLGSGLESSRVVRGMVFGREPEGIVKKAVKAKVAVYTCGLDISQTETKGTVLLKKAEDLLNFSRGEEKQLEGYFKEIADSGVKLVVAGSGIGDLALHYLNRMGIAVIKVLSKFDLRRLCRVVGATPLARLGAPTPEEAGMVDVFETVEIGGDRVTVLRQEEGEKTRTATIVLRGATANYLDDLERSLDDGVNTVRILLRDGRLVPGAGASEIELARRVAAYGGKTAGLAQHSIRRWAEACEVVPRTLAENAGLNSEDVVSSLYKAHADGKVDVGVDIESEKEGIKSTKELGVFDPFAAKDWALKLATEAAISVLRVDSIIVAKQAGIAPPKQQGHWDDD
ncbi:T-complex protein 1, theta subunit [Cryptococcus depauperatus CBS 7841]|uniref:CCT-theta n=1 Tax=Cryptococcus depauperatus CBS 7841 TaxID=1295531 RepID=A0A1E3IYW4_9TREE|nr:T-complex protein 1, theta subunit [Cryptococcus depauperatus CBS 7841]ODO02743.1 T-complex protein 1, theta subunit [Cryptococcus depauperatus CBS 7855]